MTAHTVAEEEKTIFAKTIKSLEEKLADTARDKQQSAEHFWNLTEENKKLVKKMEEVEEKHADVNKLVDEASKKQKVAEERSYMIAEDQLTFLTREREDIDVVKAELEGVRAEARGLRSLIDDILSLCFLQNFTRSSNRAIVPSSFIISHITP